MLEELKELDDNDVIAIYKKIIKEHKHLQNFEKLCKDKRVERLCLFYEGNLILRRTKTNTLNNIKTEKAKWNAASSKWKHHKHGDKAKAIFEHLDDKIKYISNNRNLRERLENLKKKQKD